MYATHVRYSSVYEYTHQTEHISFVFIYLFLQNNSFPQFVNNILHIKAFSFMY